MHSTAPPAILGQHAGALRPDRTHSKERRSSLFGLEAAPQTQVWLAISDDPAALVTGEYFYHLLLRKPLPAARDPSVQIRLLGACAALSG
jgi:hypothetical protein